MSFSVSTGALVCAGAGALGALSAWALSAVPFRELLGSLRSEARLVAKAASALAHRVAEALSSLSHPRADRSSCSLSEVSEMVDVVRLCLLAGLSFDAALDLYCSERGGWLSDALAQAHMGWQIGICSREDALMGLARASRSDALEAFAATVSQALSLGAPITAVLADQSRECRLARKAEVEQLIERAPVKILIPTGTLILPALLLSIMGPLLAAGGMI